MAFPMVNFTFTFHETLLRFSLAIRSQSTPLRYLMPNVKSSLHSHKVSAHTLKRFRILFTNSYVLFVVYKITAYEVCSKKDRTFAIKILLLILQHFKHCPPQSSPLYWQYTVPNVPSIFVVSAPTLFGVYLHHPQWAQSNSNFFATYQRTIRHYN